MLVPFINIGSGYLSFINICRGYLSFPHKRASIQILGVKIQIFIHLPEFNATLCKQYITLSLLVCQTLVVFCEENKLKLSRNAFTPQSAQ